MYAFSKKTVLYSSKQLVHIPAGSGRNIYRVISTDIDRHLIREIDLIVRHEFFLAACAYLSQNTIRDFDLKITFCI